MRLIRVCLRLTKRLLSATKENEMQALTHTYLRTIRTQARTKLLHGLTSDCMIVNNSTIKKLMLFVFFFYSFSHRECLVDTHACEQHVQGMYFFT